MSEPLDYDAMLAECNSRERIVRATHFGDQKSTRQAVKHANAAIRNLVERVRELEGRTCATCKHWEVANNSNCGAYCWQGVSAPSGQTPDIFYCKLYEPKEATG